MLVGTQTRVINEKVRSGVECALTCTDLPTCQAFVYDKLLSICYVIDIIERDFLSSTKDINTTEVYVPRVDKLVAQGIYVYNYCTFPPARNCIKKCWILKMHSSQSVFSYYGKKLKKTVIQKL